ncbi:MAG TPA: sigma-70 family RNA polymerase sigma factor [Caulobacteraceae bacterium]|jgi:RNA polymerase sigma-70 factor (ECF subfamily)|nr:sigma-70 family RNA polymerase sigma factor [Caulobacteraceae bacterium]
MAQPASRASAHDLELAALAAAGDRLAFGELVRRHGPGVRGLLRRMGADGALADDLAQDAFLAAFEQIAEFRGQGAFAGWIKRIAARLYVKRWRRDARYELLGEAEDGLSEDPRASTERRIDLDDALRTLSAAERMCVSLCYGAGLSHAEAAAALNAPLGTVKSHVKRGLDKLKARLAPDASAGLADHG